MTPDDFDAGQPSYSFRPSVLGAPRSFRLLDREIAWEIGKRSGRVPFDRIERMRLSYRPATLQTHRFQTEIWSPGTPRLDIVSSSWKSMVEQIDQSRDYRAFVLELHRRLAAANGRSRLDAGLNPLIYWFGAAVFAGAALGFAGLTVRALQAGAGLAALLIAAFVLMFLWQAGNIFYRNRPGTYRLDALPPLLLPRGTD